MVKKTVDVEHRVPDDEQPVALSIAEESGILPDVDRREDEPVVAQKADLTEGGHELVIPQPRDLSKAHERVANPDGGTFSYFDESGNQL